MSDAEIQLDFNTILWRTQSHIRAFIAGMGAAAHEVDDLAQDVYLEFYCNFDKLPPEVAPEAWLKGIARNVCLNHFRRSTRRGRLHRAALAEFLTEAKSQLEGQLSNGAVGSALEDCVAKLPPEQRQMIEMRYQQELTSQTIAERLRSTAEAVRIALFRLRAALKNCVSKTLAGQT
ncbi:MAG TPA: sigma-70 family RNA polymerase sigma factor [Planctomycetaceae bacterium]|nr:sigma-70 family RNA polymerase sigma factor [Planctomycetaceae bacterium]